MSKDASDFFKLIVYNVVLIASSKVNEDIEGQGHFLTLAQGHLHMKIKLAFPSSQWAIFSQILNVSL